MQTLLPLALLLAASAAALPATDGDAAVDKEWQAFKAKYKKAKRAYRKANEVKKALLRILDCP